MTPVVKRNFLLLNLLLLVSFYVKASAGYIADSTETNKKRKPSCLKPAEFISWVESNESGLRYKASDHKLDFYFQYRPADYIILKESANDQLILSRKELKQRRNEMEGLEYYTFTIALNDGRKDLIKSITGNQEEYNQLLLYFANHLQKDLKLVSGKDTLGCKLFHFERTYGITSYAKFVIGFEPVSYRKKKAKRTLLFKADIFGLPEIPLSIEEQDIHDIPRIIFKD